MSDELVQTEQQQLISQLMRNGQAPGENAFVTSAGGKIAGFVGKIISKYDYNYYNVRTVELNPCGFPPTSVGSSLIAVNVAESFTSQGTLAAGKYVVMFKIGEYYCFYAPVS
jgi:hypothetical protein